MAASLETWNADTVFSSLVDLVDENEIIESVSARRAVCDRCKRPVTVCWCASLPEEPINVKTCVYILQHPFEETRNLRTAPMLCQSLVPGKCHIIKGKKFNLSRHPGLEEVMRSPRTLLLYPGKDAEDLETMRLEPDLHYNLVLLDGTWAQAKGLYHQNPMMKWPRKVQINTKEKSKYVIRTQPTDGALSTLETAAYALSVLEDRPDLFQTLTRPLETLCDFQIQHGAVCHDSKAYKIENGLWTKKLSRSVQRRLLQKQQQQQQEEELQENGETNGETAAEDECDEDKLKISSETSS